MTTTILLPLKKQNWKLNVDHVIGNENYLKIYRNTHRQRDWNDNNYKCAMNEKKEL